MIAGAVSPAALVMGDPDAPFWEGWRKNERFMLHRCRTCGRHDWPATCCIEHGLAPMEWVDASGEGVIDTFTIFFKAYTRELASEVPYVVAVVRLDEGPYFHTRIAGTSPDTIRTGMRVRLRRGAGDKFPLFEKI